MPFYVVEGRAAEHAGRRWVDNSRPARVMAEVVPMTLCDGDAEGTPEYVAWVPREHAYADCANGFGANRVASDSKAI